MPQVTAAASFADHPQVRNIRQRLSLREPLAESLEIIAHLAELLPLKKDTDLKDALEAVKTHYPTCTDFERAFPSLAFSIATGVGKTRLMGAAIAYLHLAKGINNFFILAPNLTIYEKLIQDFGNPGHPKYVFQGLSQFVHHRPEVITGDNYQQASGLFEGKQIRINVFNISKFNREAYPATSGKEKGRTPRIKRLSEYLGQSYWAYLSGLNDLVILMDEAHRYHADASKKAIDELRPVLGLEMTATPFDEKSRLFKNVVYEYSLGRALDDAKFVKQPAIGTRQDFKKENYTWEEIDKIKLEDAISLHRKAQAALESYAQTYGEKKVKPFILVVCTNTTHSTETVRRISEPSFFEGYFADKVLQFDSKTKTEEVEQQILSLEHPDNPIEIVVHVNMLKEGWDVTNLYTIVPLRAANAPTLIEQTIGRGLRLPFGGKRTGVDEVDRLTVVEHENFNAVIQKANQGDSVFRQFQQIEVDESDRDEVPKSKRSESREEARQREERKNMEQAENEEEKKRIGRKIDARKVIQDGLMGQNRHAEVRRTRDLRKPKVREQVLAGIKKSYTKGGQQNFAIEEIVQEAKAIYEEVVSSFERNIIEIPRMVLQQENAPKVWFDDFELKTQPDLDRVTPSEENIQVNEIGGKDRNFVYGVEFGAFTSDTPANQIVAALLNYAEVDYELCSDLLHKLANQAVLYIEGRLEDVNLLRRTIRQWRRFIAQVIYDQLMDHFRIEVPPYEEPEVIPFDKIEPWYFRVDPKNVLHYKEDVKPVRNLPRYLFNGFAKSYHMEYQFDSKPEKDFAALLERDKTVLKWLRPAPTQFYIYWQRNARRYQPDFVVETETAIYLVEVKRDDQIETEEVRQKAEAALLYCQKASDYTARNDGKPWRYLLIPGSEMLPNTTYDYLVKRFEQKPGNGGATNINA